MQEKPANITEIAKKQRHLYLLGKVKQAKQLNSSEIRELESYEKVAKKTQKSKPKTTQQPLTDKQQKLVDCYDGDIKKAAKKANISYGYARQLLTKSHILEVIKNRQDTELRPKTIATRQQRQQFWTDVMNDDGEIMTVRLKASELLGRSEADFTDNLQHSGEISTPALVVNVKK